MVYVFMCTCMVYMLTQEMKLYHMYHAEATDAESKLKHSEEQKTKVALQVNPGSKKLKTLEQQVEKVKGYMRMTNSVSSAYAVNAVNAAQTISICA